MRGPEFLFVVLFLHFPRNVLERILHVLRERAQRFIITNLARVRRLEWLVVLHQRWCLGSSLASGVRPVLADDRQVTIE